MKAIKLTLISLFVSLSMFCQTKVKYAIFDTTDMINKYGNITEVDDTVKLHINRIIEIDNRLLEILRTRLNDENGDHTDIIEEKYDLLIEHLYISKMIGIVACWRYEEQDK